MDLNRRFAVGVHRILRLAERAGADASMLTPTHEPLGRGGWGDGTLGNRPWMNWGLPGLVI